LLYVFDVNETLLDLAGLDDILGGEQNRRTWFDLVIRAALVSAATCVYRDFADLALMAARYLETTDVVPFDAARNLPQAMSALTPHADVLPALRRMREHGHRLVVLGNSPRRVLDPQLEATGIVDLLHNLYSVEQAGALKPNPAPYHLVLNREDAEPLDAVMVAAHDWDLAGAAAVGMRTVLVTSP
jgi:2-haloacid dehalogenase